MKNLTNVLLIALISLGALFFLSGCKQKKMKGDNALMVDFTEDSFIAKPDKEVLKKSYSSEKIFWEGYRLRAVGITDVDYIPAYSAEITSQYWFLGNSLKRKKEIKNFYSAIDTAFENMDATLKGYERSVIYVPFANELIRLSQSDAEERNLFIYSDMMEHSALMDFYSKSTLGQMQNNPDTVWDALQKKVALPDLSGINVQIIYQARTSEENTRLSIVLNFYRTMLERKHAKVTISANMIL